MTEPTLDNNPQSKVPNSTVVLVMGILSIVGCCFAYGLGIIPGIIGLVMASKGMNAYRANPSAYLQSSYSQLNAGRIMSWIGVILCGLLLLTVIGVISMFGMDGLQQMMECGQISDMAERQECIQEVVEELMGG